MAYTCRYLGEGCVFVFVPGYITMDFLYLCPKLKVMEENKYDQESIRELLSWAQDTLNNKTYPEGGLVLDKCIKVIDCKSHIEAMIQMIGKNWENPTFYPTIDLFRRFRAKLEEI